MAILTMIGFYNYDGSLFDNLYVPNACDKQTLINSILLRCGEYEVLYPNLEFTKQMIDIISKKWKLSFDKWSELTKVEYNPIHNYDRLEDWTEKGNNKVSTSGTSEGYDDMQNDGLVTAYDSDQLHQNDRTNAHTSTTATNTNNSNADNTSIHTGHLRGNIGTTRTQEMLMDEIQLRKDFNVYELIADVFCEELCIMVY